MLNQLNKFPVKFACLCLGAYFLLAGCAVLQNGFEAPSISIVNIKPLSNNGLEQSFAVGLKVTNPNAIALKLAEISYVLELESIKVIKGAVKDIPSIGANRSEIVDVTVSIGLLEGLSILGQLVQNSARTVNYKLVANLDTGLPLVGILPGTDTGTVTIPNSR